MPLSLHLNGEDRTFPLLNPTSLDNFLVELKLKGDRIAVELNGVIVQRASWSDTNLRSGDRLELVQFVGGGLPVRLSSRRSHLSP